MTTMSTPLYSPLPAEHDDPWTLIEATRQQHAWPYWAPAERDGYPALPWALEELPGTAWRALYTGEGVWVDHLEPKEVYRKRAPGPLIPMAAARPGDEALSVQFAREAHIGFYDDGRFVIEHWVRVDHLTAETQLEWYGVEIADRQCTIRLLRQRLSEMEAAPERVSCYAANRNSCRRDIKFEQERLEGALALARGFADEHGLDLTPAMLNDWRMGHQKREQGHDSEDSGQQKQRVEQLALFA